MKKLFLSLVVLASVMASAEPMPVKINGMWFAVDNATMKAVLYQAKKKEVVGDITIPAVIVWQHNDYALQSIRPQAFMGCNAITSITVEEGVDSICEGAFSFCKNLKSITIYGTPVVGQQLCFGSKQVRDINIQKGNRLYGISDDININYFDKDQLASETPVSPQVSKPVIPQQLPLHSDVDKNIPAGRQNNDRVFAVIIANENYRNVASVPFALNDGYVFSLYCRKTLGIPEKNIRYVADATLNDIRIQINWLKEIISAYQGDVKIIFYYAGHGIPDEKSKSAYLLPADGIGSDAATGYPLDDVYQALGKTQMPEQPHAIVLLDACFSGATRQDNMLASARGVAIKVKHGQPLGNTVALTAATGDQTAYQNEEQQHGMFTYYLLKKLQDSKGDATIQELADYVTMNVRQQSVLLNGKSQTPTLMAAPAASDWQQWKLK